jgi:hypothetical protein
MIADSSPGESPIFLVPEAADEPLMTAVERGLGRGGTNLDVLPTLGDLALGDPFFAQELVDLHRKYEVRPQPVEGLLARLRQRLAWWLIGPELAQANAAHASLVRVIDSLTAHLDDERAARMSLESRITALERSR